MDLSGRETSNSLGVANSLLGDEDPSLTEGDLGSTTVIAELQEISPDLDSRWRGAVFSLSPRNPDAARHFCTSAREIFTQILEITAPDKDVLRANPNCMTTDSGKPSRRSKIQFLLDRKGLADDALESFVEDDMDNIIQLFRLFNDGTHGSSGRFTISQLVAVKRRVENGIQFLYHIAI